MSRTTKPCWTRWRPMAAPPRLSCAARWRSAPLPAPPPMTRRCRTGLPANWRRTATTSRRAAAPLAGLLRQPLRYGENPHQEAAFYVDGSAAARRRHAPNSSRARNCPTTTSTTPTRPMSWWRSSIPKPRPPAPSSSMPIPAAWRWARRLKDAYLAALACDTAKRLWRRAGLQPARWTAPRRKKSPRSSPK